ncbi:TetR/AcrR family transcriptional regulator [Marinomonas rhizomae]|uniref:TetR family transcriptional regulator n=1 Tax=Marinomonas rhizomae TaxID=491948 RepID=A0A366J7W0_9GAMM|nr:TetR/AcrR family transcriptional regulator [Marinomonas rhizomae]RBP83121.1 TetR family transcriptional regulator [Marinomonas rhizomae]RNF72578.1 TetR/AcrR family transcriptional regulator [Marinomonas rhizomae]
MRSSKQPCLKDQRIQCIIDATEQHVLTKGFHKASMSEIAKSAGLSVGQIYRYFAHKDDIIRALVEQSTQKKLQFMSSFLNKEKWLDRHFLDETEDTQKIRIMHSEVQAEAARNPVVFDICQDSQNRLQQHAIEILQTRQPNMSVDEAASRIEMLVTLTEGLMARWEFQQRPLSKEMYQMYSQVIDTILPDTI